MKNRPRVIRNMLLVLLPGLVAACTPEAGLRLTFDGSACALTGNTDLEVGDQPIAVVNSS